MLQYCSSIDSTVHHGNIKLLSLIQAQQTLEDIGLAEHADIFATDLCVGQQRQLCVGMAIIGNPKVTVQ